MRQGHVSPDVRQLRVDEGGNRDRWCRERRARRRRGTLGPRAEPRGHAVAQQDRETQRRSIVSAMASERHVPQDVVTRDKRGRRRTL